MKKFKLFILLTLLLKFTSATVTFSQIVLSEIMFDPIGSEYYDEFIELYNTSAVDTVDLAWWVISDSSDYDIIIPHESGTKLAPGQFALILDSGYFENSDHYDGIIPDDALILTINNATFGSGGLSNSTAEPVILIAATGDTVAKYRYSLDNEPGYSDEKINLFGSDNADNWANSRVLNGTPGKLNSVQPMTHDLSVELVAFPETLQPDQSVTLVAQIKNLGLSSAFNFELNFYHDTNLDSIYSHQEQISSTFLFEDSLAQNDTVQQKLEVENLKSGHHRFFAGVSYSPDQDSYNNLSSAEVKVGFPEKSLVINEIMFRPNSNEPEWVELFNPRDDSINIQHWKLSDSRTDNKLTISVAPLFIPADGYFIIADDSTFFDVYPNCTCQIMVADNFPALNNSGDAVTIYDLTGTIIDQVNYQSNWGSKTGVSLERILFDGESDDPVNWALSQSSDGSTPCLKNSVAPREFDLLLKSSSRLVDAGSIQTTVTIVNLGVNPISDFRCEIYLDENLDSLAQQNELFDEYDYVGPALAWYDSTQYSFSIPDLNSGINQIIAKLIAPTDEDTSNNYSIHRVFIPFSAGKLLINEVMFKPLSGMPEWIEIYNPGVDSVNLLNWFFSDSNTEEKLLISDSTFWLNSSSYVVISQSASLTDQFPSLNESHVIVPSSWPTLNNTFDQLLIFDPTFQTIDSMAYYNSWSEERGVSLERVDFFNPNVDSTNWSPSIDSLGGTPGGFNSVSPLDFDLAVIETHYLPKNPFPGDRITFFTVVQNVGRKSVLSFELTYFIDYNLDNTFQSDEKIGESLSFDQILPPNEIVTTELTAICPESGQYKMLAQLKATDDLKKQNDTLSTVLSVGFAEKSLVINEIMYSPDGEMPEWIELYNPLSRETDVKNWSFADSDSAHPIQLTHNHLFVSPNSFLIVSQDSMISDHFDLSESDLIIIKNLPNLNNDEDYVFIFDANKNLIDEVHYFDDWGGEKGVSLERINPNLTSSDSSNWASSVDLNGATPGRKNSIFVDVLPPSAQLSISPNPFSPDNDGFDDVTVISYKLPFNLSQIRIKIFDIRGRLVRILVNNQTSSTENSIIWDGKDNAGNFCRMGIYIVYLEAIHYQKGVVKSIKDTVVLANQL